jgi:hypothetical protein
MVIMLFITGIINTIIRDHIDKKWEILYNYNAEGKVDLL